MSTVGCCSPSVFSAGSHLRLVQLILERTDCSWNLHLMQTKLLTLLEQLHLDSLAKFEVVFDFEDLVSFPRGVWVRDYSLVPRPLPFARGSPGNYIQIS